MSEIKTLNGYNFVDTKAREDIATLAEEIDSGTGSVQPDWSENDPTSKAYVQNRTHWTEIGEIEILPEATYTILSADEPIAVIMSPVTLVSGENYTVTYNGMAYNCPAFNDDDGNVMLGNGTAFASHLPPSDAPFAIGRFTDEQAAEIGFYGMILPLDGSTTFTLSIKGKGEVVHPLPKKYLGELRGQQHITIMIAEDGTITSDTPYYVAAKMDMSELQGAVKIVNSAAGEVYSACFAMSGINVIGLDYITIGFIPAIDIRDVSGLSQSIHTLDWFSYAGINQFAHSSVQTLPRCRSAESDSFFLVWEVNGNASSEGPDGGGTWRAYNLERFRSYLAPKWTQTETITITEDTTEVVLNTDNINLGGFYCVDDVFIRMHTPAATVAGAMQATLTGRYDSDGTISLTAQYALQTKESYTLFRIKNVNGYLEIETNEGSNGSTRVSWKGMFPSDYMKVRGGFKKVKFSVVAPDMKIPAGTTFEVWSANTMGDIDL